MWLGGGLVGGWVSSCERAETIWAKVWRGSPEPGGGRSFPDNWQVCKERLARNSLAFHWFGEALVMVW